MQNELIPLARLDDWQLEHEQQDIRGWPLRDVGGTPIGTIRDMLVDREHERVAAVTLSDGSTVPVERIAIRDHHVELKAVGDLAGTPGQGHETVREERIPIVEEQIKVGKRKVESGGVRIQTQVVQQPVHDEIRLRDEHVEVERRPVEDGRFDPEAAPHLLRDRDVEMREIDEEAVVEKAATVKEELVVRKEARERLENVDTTVRNTKVEVEQLDAKH